MPYQMRGFRSGAAAMRSSCMRWTVARAGSSIFAILSIT